MINYKDYINKIKKLTSNVSNVGMNFYSLKQNIETLIKLLEEMLKENQGLKKELARLKLKNDKLELSNKKDSHNSHLPPSTDKEKRYPDKKKKSKKKSGGQEGHKGSTLERVNVPDQIINYKLKGSCAGCGISLSNISKKTFIKKQVLDIKFLVHATDHVVECGRCNCGITHMASHPEELNAPVQYGASVKSFVSYLSNYQLIPFERTQDLFRDLFNLPMSEGTIFNISSKCHERLEKFETLAKKALLNSKVNHADESPININAVKNYLHVLSNEFITLLSAHSSRGLEALKTAGVLKNYKGFLVSDFYSMYYSLKAVNVACHSHLGREFTLLEEEFKIKWAKQMRKFFLRANKEIKKFRRKKIPIPYSNQESYRIEFEKILTRAKIENPEYLKKGKKTDAENLLLRLINNQDAVLRFTTDIEIPFTNNLAERDLRMSKVKQKISGGFRTFKGFQKYARLRSYISTVKKQGRNVFKSLMAIFSSQNPNYIELFT